MQAGMQDRYFSFTTGHPYTAEHFLKSRAATPDRREGFCGRTTEPDSFAV
jgi:hypothetical protein